MTALPDKINTQQTQTLHASRQCELVATVSQCACCAEMLKSYEKHSCQHKWLHLPMLPCANARVTAEHPLACLLWSSRRRQLQSRTGQCHCPVLDSATSVQLAAAAAAIPGAADIVWQLQQRIG